MDLRSRRSDWPVPAQAWALVAVVALVVFLAFPESPSLRTNTRSPSSVTFMTNDNPKVAIKFSIATAHYWNSIVQSPVAFTSMSFVFEDTTTFPSYGSVTFTNNWILSLYPKTPKYLPL